MAPAPELSDLIRDIGVEQVDHPGVVARFVLPELGTVPPDDRQKLLLHVRSNWAELKQNQALVDQFKEVRGRGTEGGREATAVCLVGHEHLSQLPAVFWGCFELWLYVACVEMVF